MRVCKCLQPKRNQCLMIHTKIGLVRVAGAGTDPTAVAAAQAGERRSQNQQATLLCIDLHMKEKDRSRARAEFDNICTIIAVIEVKLIG